MPEIALNPPPFNPHGEKGEFERVQHAQRLSALLLAFNPHGEKGEFERPDA